MYFPKSAAMRSYGQWKEGLLGPLGSLPSVDLAYPRAGRSPILQPPASSLLPTSLTLPAEGDRSDSRVSPLTSQCRLGACFSC